MRIDSAKGSRVYTPLSLKLYDWWVLDISNRFAWRCPTQQILLPHFRRHLGKNHLDIGVGTGYYLAQLSGSLQQVSLLDLNPFSLTSATERIGTSRITKTIRHDVYQALPSELTERYDSVSLFYLLHCLPGDMSLKATALANIKSAVTQNGTVYGATILGSGVEHNAFGRKLMSVYNKKGIFGNQTDSLLNLKAALQQHFREVDITLHGTVALFAATDKI
ncbi:class I SAM-dependent methyltransferase [Erwinia psidii]|uniref:Class I SAM-dependent methyltransferase n=1 Tax=Erwinia psidii TaxID=69224 RepID=A0A3N6V0Z3_9GAMM|nr:class I SAM-dependent methyltransferase [Erwinia psidii]MCX8956028.1 class I SAM-dependent methyltransferase [Erwinia psidii]MCX8961402.1 class I SAM-dependent methyltransferase [Erwinia psidii]MCX8963752.1 class I SAM-dependent methyltransferase [Erwinia psidii]RQM38735.1 class I SAM-dependent methyltransferase [Erwinia psidii]